MGDDRPRSRSPRRNRERKPRGGFAWKDKEKSRADASDRSSRHSGLDRGYRRRSNSPRRRDDEKDRDRHRDRGTRGWDGERDGERDRRDRDRDRRDKERPEKDRMHKDRAVKVKSSTTSSVAAPQEEMIIVHVNDRLGTKAAIPCFASDRVKEFKILVAARIGREPHEILLKRQGERPFKDQLQLVDYGVSNGVQIDLEVDTGD